MELVMETNGTKTKAMLMHLSTLTQYIIPLGNFIFPIVLWSSLKKDSGFLDENGKNAINFQISIFIYSLVLCLVAIPIFLFTIFSHLSFEAMVRDEDVFLHNFSVQNISGIVILAVVAVILFFFLKVAEFFLVLVASVKATEGVAYKYPLTIPFIK